MHPRPGIRYSLGSSSVLCSQEALPPVTVLREHPEVGLCVSTCTQVAWGSCPPQTPYAHGSDFQPGYNCSGSLFRSQKPENFEEPSRQNSRVGQ